jgi:uncharacterized protein
MIGLADVIGGLINALSAVVRSSPSQYRSLGGIPPVAENVTNTVALCPGYLGDLRPNE